MLVKINTTDRQDFPHGSILTVSEISGMRCSCPLHMSQFGGKTTADFYGSEWELVDIILTSPQKTAIKPPEKITSMEQLKSFLAKHPVNHVEYIGEGGSQTFQWTVGTLDAVLRFSDHILFSDRFDEVLFELKVNPVTNPNQISFLNAG